MMKKLFQGFAVLAALLLTGCGMMERKGDTAGDRKEYSGTLGAGKVYTIVSAPQHAPRWLVRNDDLNYVVRGKPTAAQRAAVRDVEQNCAAHATNASPSRIVEIGSNAVLYGLAGAIGVGSGASAAFKGAKFVEYAKYGGSASAFSGAANGAITSGGWSYTFEDCGRTVFHLYPEVGVFITGTMPW